MTISQSFSPKSFVLALDGVVDSGFSALLDTLGTVIELPSVPVKAI